MIEVWDCMLGLLFGGKTDVSNWRIKQAIMADPQNTSYTERGIEPLFAAPKTARINIVGQAPGLKTQEAGIYWKDKSGDRLREWLGVDEDTFYNSGYFAVSAHGFLLSGAWQVRRPSTSYRFCRKMASATLARVARYPINSLDWAICPSILFTWEN